jgi:6-phosphogluconolactonase
MKSRFIQLVLVSLFLMIVFTGCSNKVKLVTGSYSVNGDSGINVFDFNPSDGSLKLVTSFNAGPNPSYFCFNRNLNLVYAINEVDSFRNSRSGGLTTLKHDGNFGDLQKINEIAVPNGGPCYISITPQNDFLLIANYGGGSVAVVKLDGTGIPVNVTDKEQLFGGEGAVSHAHMIITDVAGNRIYVSDLGLDRIWIFDLDRSTGKLTPAISEGVDLPKGTGPRHFLLNEAGTKLYAICELNSTINVFNVDKEKGLVHLQTISTLKEGFTGENSCADIHVSSSGKYLYGSNRGENDIVTYTLNEDGMLKLAGHSDCGGNWPRNFVLDPAGKYLLAGNQRSGNISVFKIDSKTGIPSKKLNDYMITAPACLKFK